MASIQQSMGSAFNALLVAGLGASRAIQQSKPYQERQEIKALEQQKERGYTELEQLNESDLMEQYVKDMKAGVKDSAAGKILEEAGMRQQNIAGRLLQLDPTPERTAEYHEISQYYGSLSSQATRAYWDKIREKRQQKETLEERKKIGGAN